MERGHLFLVLTATWQTRVGTSNPTLPLSCPQRRVTQSLVYRVSFTVLLRQVKDPFSPVLQLVRGWVSSPTLHRQ